MSIACPVDLDTARLRAEIQSIYTRVAATPAEPFHFHRGAAYAAERLRYDAAELATLPNIVTDSFAGVGNPLAIAPLAEGAVVVDLGCGAGTDLLLAAKRVGPRGRAIGVDMTDEMRRRARDGATSTGLDNVDVREGDATTLPVVEGGADVVISNGVMNLIADKRLVVEEIRRVLKPGGRLQLADVVLGVDLPDSARREVDLWTG
jgi:arsenite methyltransferase